MSTLTVLALRVRRTLAVVLVTVLAATAATVVVVAPSATAPAQASPGGGGDDGRPAGRGPRDPMQAALDRMVERGAVGVTAELVRPAGTWLGAAGTGQVKPHRDAAVDARFRAASVTKQLVAVLALQLVETGAWTLDTTLGEVLPGVWPGRDAVTLRQLLSHTSGAPDYLPELIAGATTTRTFLDALARRRTDAGLVDAAQRRPWQFDPGSDFGYANTNYVLVGMMLEAETGAALPDLVADRVLAPARMTASAFDTRRGLPAPRLREYAVLGGERVALTRFHPSMFSGAGALVTTARDLDRFQLALSTGGLVDPGLVTEMRSVQSPDEDGLAYGLGSYRIADPCGTGRFFHGHDGASFGTLTLSFTSPSGRRRVTIAMTGRDLDGRGQPAKALNDALVEALTLGRPACREAAGRRSAVDLPWLDLR